MNYSLFFFFPRTTFTHSFSLFPGVLFLQVGNNTRQAVMPNVVTSLDTVRALFVRTFPERLSMAALNSPDARLYILDEGMDAFRPLDSHW